MQAHVELGMLLSRYGALLTERQRALLSMAVDEDLSLAEIAERAGISRQGVRDAIQRASAQLHAYEQALGMERKAWAIREKAKALAALPCVQEDGEAQGLIQDIVEMIDDGI